MHPGGPGDVRTALENPVHGVTPTLGLRCSIAIAYEIAIRYEITFGFEIVEGDRRDRQTDE